MAPELIVRGIAFCSLCPRNRNCEQSCQACDQSRTLPFWILPLTLHWCTVTCLKTEPMPFDRYVQSNPSTVYCCVLANHEVDFCIIIITRDTFPTSPTAISSNSRATASSRVTTTTSDDIGFDLDDGRYFWFDYEWNGMSFNHKSMKKLGSGHWWW